MVNPIDNVSALTFMSRKPLEEGPRRLKEFVEESKKQKELIFKKDKATTPIVL